MTRKIRFPKSGAATAEEPPGALQAANCPQNGRREIPAGTIFSEEHRLPGLAALVDGLQNLRNHIGLFRLDDERLRIVLYVIDPHARFDFVRLARAHALEEGRAAVHRQIRDSGIQAGELFAVDAQLPPRFADVRRMRDGGSAKAGANGKNPRFSTKTEKRQFCAYYHTEGAGRQPPPRPTAKPTGKRRKRMSTAEILTIVFAAVAAVSGIAALVIALMKRSASGGAFDGRALREEQKRDKEDIIHEVDFVRKAISESNTQSNVSVSNMLANYLGNAEKQTNGLIEYMGKAMQQLAQAEKENADKTDEVVGKNLEAVKTEFKTGVADMRGDLGKQFTEIRQELAQQVDRMRGEMRERLSEVRADNEKQLEKMRATVDEKLSETLNTRIQAAFQQVSERLDSVQKGFGEMRELTSSVGNLNRIFSNVKTRGNWGEVSLQSLLEQILAPEQYKTQFYVTPRSREAVDFAIVMPGQAGEEVYLPIDAKFPLEDYYRLLDASDDGDKAAVELARKALRDRVKSEARSINEKYIKVPRTTNFAVLYVPNEGLYAEILRDGSFASDLQTQYRVTVCGPTTISALLNSLQVGFTTLRIQKKSGEIIKLMQAVRTDFSRFTGLIDKIKKQAQTVVNTVEDIDNRNRILTKKLDKLGDDMPEGYVEGEAAASLDAPPAGEEE